MNLSAFYKIIELYVIYCNPHIWIAQYIPYTVYNLCKSFMELFITFHLDWIPYDYKVGSQPV